MQAVQRIKREKRMDGGKEKEEGDDPHTSAAKQMRPLRIRAELLLAERLSCIPKTTRWASGSKEAAADEEK